MKGLLTPRQLKQIKEDRYDLYEVLVAKHMWHVIKYRLQRNVKWNMNLPTRIVSSTKSEVSSRYDVNWEFGCLLCEMYYDVDGCNECPLKHCGYDSSYYAALRGSMLACDDIIEAIEHPDQERGVYDV